MRTSRIIAAVTITLLLAEPTPPAAAFDLDFLIPSFLSGKRPPEPQRVIRPERPRPQQPQPQRQPFSVPTSDAEKPAPSASQIVTVLGDSLGIQLGQGLRDAMQPKPDVGIVSKARGSTGLINPAERDWPKFTRELGASADRNSLTVIMLGSNDGQPLRDETGVIQEIGSDRWIDLYAKRVDDMLAPLKDRKVPVVWVGLPAPRSEKLGSSFLTLNKIYRERVEKAGFRYVDIWEAFVDENGRFSESGPDIAGEIVKLRAADGVHFTKSGYRKLAFFVERDLGKFLQSGETLPDTGVMPDELREQIKLQSEPKSASDAIDLRAAVPLPDVAALAPELRKREAGPIVPLTAQPVATNGALVSQAPVVPPADPALRDAARLSEEVFGVGKAQYPKPNRGDDFGWPRR